MGNKIVEGLWDCPYCGSKAIGGLTKHCPNCGHPQDNGTRFYMGEKKNYLDEELAKKYGQGADWTCSYCGSLNRFHFRYCTNCGAPKEETSGDYFENIEKQEQKRKQKSVPEPKNDNNKGSGIFLKRLLPLFLIIIAAALIFGFISRPKNANIKITDKAWERSIEVEGMRTVRESD